MTRTAIKNFITTSLDVGVDAHSVRVTLENLHTNDPDIIVDGDIFQWCLAELEKQNKIRYPDSPSLEEMATQPLNEVHFGKVEVQNSIFACHLLEQSDKDFLHLACLHSLFEANKSTKLRLETKKRRFIESTEYRAKEFLTTKSPSDSKIQVYKSTEMIELSNPATTAGAVHQYLIAKGATKLDGHVTYYIAFSSHQSLREWRNSHTSFEDGKFLYILIRW